MNYKRKKPNNKKIFRSYNALRKWSWKKSFVRDYMDVIEFKRNKHVDNI